jgi:hypothetical protein
MKITILMGRGIEGCGVTKFTLEENDWFVRQGHDSTIFAPSDKSWTRKTSHNCSTVQHVKFAKEEEINKIVTRCNESDLVIITSLPSVSHPEKCIEGFKRVLSETKRPIVLIQLDHKMASIKRNAALDEAIKASSVMFSLSRYNDFAEYANALLGSGGLDAFMGSGEPTTEIHSYQVGYQFEPNKKEYWKDIKEQDAKHHKWIGRTTSWKGYQQMFKFHNNFLRKNGCLTTFEGIEKSPAYLGFKELSEFNPVIEQNPETYDLSKGYGDLVYVFGPYNNEQLLHRLSRVGFGYQLSLLDQKYIENALEYTHCEVIATGTVPVFRAGWGRRAKHRTTQVPLIDCKDTGTVWLDDDNMEPAFELIKKLENDAGMRDEWRNMAFEFYKEHQDAEYIFGDMWNKMKSYINVKE